MVCSLRETLEFVPGMSLRAKANVQTSARRRRRMLLVPSSAAEMR